MHWDQVIGQSEVVDLLRRAVKSNRVGHAYLFHGPDGVGKRAVALALARALQCEKCTDTDICSPCEKITRLQHPDVDVYMPQPTGTPPEAVAERLQLLAENVYAPVDFVRAPVIKGSKSTKTPQKLAIYSIDRINSALRFTMNRRPREGRYRIAIITDAEALEDQAANTFLKLLEEPGPQTVFILTTNRLDVLLPTIVSRCQKIVFPALSHQTIHDALIDQHDLNDATARTVAIIADGSYSRALALAQNAGLHQDRARVLTILRSAYSGNVKKQMELVEELSTASREQLKSQLSLMLGWIRDIVLYRELQEEALVLNHDQIKNIRRFCHNLPNADLDALPHLVNSAYTLVESNINTRLLLITLIQALGRAMRGSHHGKLFTPLTGYSDL